MVIQAPPGVAVREVKLHLFYHDGDMMTLEHAQLEEIGQDKLFPEVVDMVVATQKERIWQYTVRIALVNRQVIRFTYQIEDNKAKFIRKDEYKE